MDDSWRVATCHLQVEGLTATRKGVGWGGVCSGLKRVFGHAYPGKEEN